MGHFLKKVCHASVSGGYANILFRKARAAGAAAAARAGGGSTAVQPRFSGSTAPLPSSTGLNRVKPLCEVPDPNEHVGVEKIVADRGKGILVITGIESTPCPLKGLKSTLDSITLNEMSFGPEEELFIYAKGLSMPSPGQAWGTRGFPGGWGASPADA